MKNENRYIVKNTGICKCGAFNSGLPRSSFLTARNDGNVVILLLFTLFIATTTVFPQQYIHTLNKDSINQRDWIGKQGIWYLFDDSTGIIHSKTTYENNLKHGYFEEYDAYGRITKHGFYKYGMLDSLYREYENGEIFITAYFNYGIPVGIVSESGEKIYAIKCSDNSKGTFARSTDLVITEDGEFLQASKYLISKMKCNDSNEIFTYSFSYFDEEQGANYIKGGIRKEGCVCPRIDTVCGFGLVESIYYNGCLYKEIYYKIYYRKNIRVRLFECFFVDEKKTMTIVYRSRKPYNIEGIAYYDKDGKVYKEIFYNKKGNFKKMYEWEPQPNGKWTRWTYK